MYIPHTDNDREEMLHAVGVKEIEKLFTDVPSAHIFPELDIPPALTEMEAVAHLEKISQSNQSVRDLTCFLGAGAYNHFTPAAVDSILRRGEFLTAYTPYQPEISQGTLQAIFDYQSLVATLTGMEVSNASHYDGATAAAEAVNMAYANFRGKKSRVVLSPALHPQYRETIRTYTRGSVIDIVGDTDGIDPHGDPEDLISFIDDNTALVMVQYPDFFGRIYDFKKLAEAAHEKGALISISTNPLSLGLLTPPGEFNADIVTGEGQALGLPLSYGGPYLGLFATRKKFVRKMAGRLAGETVDVNGQRGFVLTLTAREQHIRREKATSNICTNQGLMALASTVYMSMLGKGGLREVAELCYQKAHYAAKQINSLPNYVVLNDTPFFNEFIVRCPYPVDKINQVLLEREILGGYDLGLEYVSLKEHMLIAVTEMNSRQDIELLVSTLAEVSDD